MIIKNKMHLRQTGFSLVEIMVGLVIGLLATLVIMQVFATFEGQKRTTTGSADAQTNGSIALFTIQRDMLMAGFGLPVFDKQNPPLKCDPTVTVDHDSVAATAAIDMFPIAITEGGAGASDTIRIRYATDSAIAKNGVAVKIVGLTAPVAGVDNNLGCNDGDVVLISSGTSCVMTRVNDTDLAVDTTHITLQSSAGAVIGASLACMGKWNQFTYSVVGNQLQRNDASIATPTPIVSEIVNIQAQYGISATADSNKIVNWVSASGAWAAPSIADRNRIRAIHVAVVARNGLMEKDNVTQPCTTTKGTVNQGPCAWDDADLDPAPVLDLSIGDANWQRYRYRVYETIIPLRNLVWAFKG